MHITKKNFDTEVMKCDIPVLLDFWAPWCGPCKMLGPVLEELSSGMSGKVKVCKINVDDEQALAQKFGVSSIPTLVVMKNGKVATTSVGFKKKEVILAMLKV